MIKLKLKKADVINKINESNYREPLEEYNEITDTSMTLDLMHSEALNKAVQANDLGFNIDVERTIFDFDGIRGFYIDQPEKHGINDCYVVYQIRNKIYYRPGIEFNEICEDIKHNVRDINALEFDYNNVDELLDFIDSINIDECIDLIDIIFKTFGVYLEIIKESIKIRKPSLSANGDFEKSKKVDDILHGDKEKKDFEEKVEKETQKEGLDNPLAPVAAPQEESLKFVLPNAHTTLESKLDESKKDIDKRMKNNKGFKNLSDDFDITYEPADWVIIKETGMKAQVIDVVNNGDGELTMLTILAADGKCYDVEDLKEITPDPMYLVNLPGRTINSQKLTVPRLGECDVDPKTRLTRTPQNEKIPTLGDLNGKTVKVDIVVEGHKLNAQPYSAFVEDIKNSKKALRVINENLEVEEFENKNIEFVEKPYAVIVDDNGKPVRTIQVDPESYINAAENDLVDCECAGKATKFPKKCIDILS